MDLVVMRLSDESFGMCGSIRVSCRSPVSDDVKNATPPYPPRMHRGLWASQAPLPRPPPHSSTLPTAMPPRRAVLRRTHIPLWRQSDWRLAWIGGNAYLAQVVQQKEHTRDTIRCDARHADADIKICQSFNTPSFEVVTDPLDHWRHWHAEQRPPG